MSKKEDILVSQESIENIISELNGLKDLILSKDSIDDKEDILNEGIEEIIYNIGLLIDGQEYLSDEYAYLAKNVREC